MNKRFFLLTIAPLALFLLFGASPAHAQIPLYVPTQEQGIPLEVQMNNQSNGQQPGWVQMLESCSDYQTTLESSMKNLDDTLVDKQIGQEAANNIARIMKAREDVNKLVASVYNELQTQQVVNGIDINDPKFDKVMQTVGIVVEGNDQNPNDQLCKASYQVRANIERAGQCVAVAQEARIITNQDDYIYEEGIRRAMDMLFCYLGDWRHFPIAATNDPLNCKELGLDPQCSVEDVWKALGEKLSEGLSGNPTPNPNYFKDVDGTLTTDRYGDDQHVFNLCEGMRALGRKCAQDVLRDFIKYSTIAKITRKDRTIILAPPQTWYTPGRCRIIDGFLPTSDFLPPSKDEKTPYVDTIKSIDLFNAENTTKNSKQRITYLFDSKWGSPDLAKQPSEMNASEFSLERELAAYGKDENNASGLASKAETLAQNIITQFNDLRKLQYTSGDGLRDATLRIGWQDYEWEQSTNTMPNKLDDFLGKYNALDLPADTPERPNKLFKPLGCYWYGEEFHGDPLTEENKTKELPRCLSKNDDIKAKPEGKTFYFDTGLVLSPIAILKDKLQSAIQAQFDLARDAFAVADTSNPLLARLMEKKKVSVGECTSKAIEWVAPSVNQLVAPFEDVSINLAQSIDPNTKEDYTKNSHIPYILGNYFNHLYNDVFQLYHTQFPNTLEEWFNSAEFAGPKDENPGNQPKYDSIYEQITNTDLLPELFADKGPGGLSPEPRAPGPSPSPGPIGSLPGGCNALKGTFQDVASRSGVDACLLVGIAGAESTCGVDLGPSSSGACGFMQILPKTATGLMGRGKSNPVTCAELQSDPKLSIELAARYFVQSAQTLGTYSSRGFDIGNSFTQSGKTVTYGPFTYDNGNDDLIASYNAGQGGGEDTPFTVSNDCSDPVTPAWQCNINSGGYGTATQPYVLKVQKFQKQCSGGFIDTPTAERAAAQKVFAEGHWAGAGSSCGNVGSKQVLQSVAGGAPPPVCSSGCTGSSICSPNPSVNLNLTMLSTLDAMDSEGLKFRINSLTTGSHVAGSAHYKGNAVDIKALPGTTYPQLEARLRPVGNFVQCELGRGVIPCSGSPDHIHVAF